MNSKNLLIAAFLVVWICIGLNLAKSESPTFDEPVHLKAAVEYSKGSFDFDPIEPPLLRRFVYLFAGNIESARGVIVIVTGLLISVLLINPLTAFFFLSEPNLLAHSHYFTTDAVSSIASVIAALLIISPAALVLLTALFVAFSASVKVASLALIIPLLLIKAKRFGFKGLLFIIIFSIIFIWATYDFHWQIVINHLDLKLPFGGYLRAFKENILFARRGQPIWFNGQISLHAPLLKTPLILLTKTGLPLLIAALLASLTGFRQTAKYWLIFIIVFGVNLLKPLNFGIRHLLPAEIALIMIASLYRPKSRVGKTVLLFLIVWQIYSLVRVWPQPITFTNELVGTKSYQLVSDSDFDWGQGLIELNREINTRGIKFYQLAYFGNVDPAAYLPPFVRIKDSNPVASRPVEPIDYHKTIIISETCYYQCGYYLDPVLSQKPIRIIAKSFFIFND